MGLGCIHPWLQLLCALCRIIKVEMNFESVFSNRLKVWLKEEKKFNLIYSKHILNDDVSMGIG